MRVAYLLFFVTLAGGGLIWHGFASRPARLQVRVRCLPQKGRLVFDIQLQGIVRATPQQTWAVLTDYARLPEFIPDLMSSTLVSRSGNESVLEQHGRAGFLFMQQAVHIVVRVTEQPLVSLKVALISGNMKHYTSHWKLAPLAGQGGTQIDYHGHLEPDFFVPRLLGRALVQRDTRRMLAAVVSEIEYRARQGG